MGIQGLLPLLKKIHSPVNVSKFEGCTVAIDAYCWLHKGAFACADKLALGEKTDQYVYYCMKYLEYMLRKNVKPIMVFDGCRLPSKKDVEKSRREKREMYRKKAAQMLREGKRSEARECLQRCIDISPEMALELMNTCRARGVDCIVAPYEADAQLAFLSKAGIAQAIITEDSDLLLFGCDQVIFKMDHFGNGILIESRRLNEVLGIADGFYTFEKFRYMCIMSGCDYLPSLPGIGLGKACRVFKMARQTDLKILLKKFPSTYLKMSLTVPEEYLNNFTKADNTFLYQLVFNPLTRELVPLNPYLADIKRDDLEYAGPNIPANKALHIALGNINIYTMEKFANFDPDRYVPPKANKKSSASLHMLSIWNKNYRIRPKFVDKQPDDVARPNLQGKEQKCSVRLKKKSPSKRPRSVEESLETKSDTELSGMYISTSPLKEESTNRGIPLDVMSALSPCRKRLRLDTSPSVTDETEWSDSQMEDSLDLMTTPKKEQKSPKSPERTRFITSLKEADTVVSINTLGSPEGESPKGKENELQSPKRNKFAVNIGKRPRFNINATKEVKSRFFLSSPDKSKKELSTPTEDKPQDTDTVRLKVDSVHLTENTSERRSSPITKNKLKSPEPEPKVKLKGQTKLSPGSAFSWSKFKFTKQAEKQSPKVNTQFKKVVNNPGLKNYFRKTLSNSELELGSGEGESVKDKCVSASQPSPSCRGDSPHGSQSDVGACHGDGLQCTEISVCGSIDSFCRTDSQVSQYMPPSQDTPPSLPSLPPSGNHGDEEEEDVVHISSPPSTIHVSTPMPSSRGGMAKGACRVAGLSRGKKPKTAAKSKPMDNKQRSITDLFSKFSHSSSAPKLRHSDSIVVKKEEEEMTGTPSMNNQLFSSAGSIQRKLLH